MSDTVVFSVPPSKWLLVDCVNCARPIAMTTGQLQAFKRDAQALGKTVVQFMCATCTMDATSERPNGQGDDLTV